MPRSRYKVPFRRRRQGKTDYYLRRKLIISRKKRLIIRKSSKHIQLQIIEAEMTGDKTLAHAHSKDLAKVGWHLSCGNLPAAYLSGLLLAKKAKENKLDGEELILDIGPTVMQYGTRTFAALKGAVDGGLNIAHSDVVFPTDERISGKHIDDYMTSITKNEEDSIYQFGKVLDKDKPGVYVKTFESCKKNLV